MKEYARSRKIRSLITDVGPNGWLTRETPFRLFNQTTATLGQALRNERQFTRRMAALRGFNKRSEWRLHEAWGH